MANEFQKEVLESFEGYPINENDIETMLQMGDDTMAEFVPSRNIGRIIATRLAREGKSDEEIKRASDLLSSGFALGFVAAVLCTDMTEKPKKKRRTLFGIYI